MLKFFRKIRRNLLSEGKTGKYLKYAIGEIVLVVIGILIALQINTWNNHRLALKKEIVFLKELEMGLRNDLEEEINPSIEYTEKNMERHRVLMSVLDSNRTDIPRDSIRDLLSTLALPWEFSMNIAPFNNLNSVGIDLISNDSLRHQITNFYGYSILWPISHGKYHREWSFNRMIPVIQDNTDFWSGSISESELEFFRSEHYAKNRFPMNNSFWNTTALYRYKRVKSQAESLLRNIRSEIDKLKSE